MLLLSFENNKAQMQQLAHCGTDEGLLGPASGEQAFISGFDMRVGLNEMKANIVPLTITIYTVVCFLTPHPILPDSATIHRNAVQPNPQ